MLTWVLTSHLDSRSRFWKRDVLLLVNDLTGKKQPPLLKPFVMGKPVTIHAQPDIGYSSASDHNTTSDSDDASFAPTSTAMSHALKHQMMAMGWGISLAKYCG
jgi:hypothetical protein